MFQILYAAFRENGKPTSKPLPLEIPTRDLASEKVLSVVHCDEVGPAVVAQHSLSDDIEHPQVLPGAMSYRLLNSIDAIEDAHLKKHMRKGTTAIETLERLLQRVAPDANPAVNIGKSAFICSPQMSNDDKHCFNMSEVFNEVQLQFGNGVKSTQYFNARFPAIKPKLLKGPSPIRFKSIHINSGMCLGSKAVLAMSPGHGQGDDCVIPKVPENEEPTLYELETIARLSSGIADAAALFGGCSSHTAINVCLDVPDFQYYWTVWELFNKNLVTMEYIQDWMAAIRRRRAQLQNIMMSSIYKMLLDRGIGDIKVSLATSTSAAVELLQERSLSGVVPSLEELLLALQTQGTGSAQWEEFLTHLEPGEQPADGTDLGKLMYVFEAVKYALKSQSSTNENTREAHGERLIIFLDDTAECRIFNRASKFIKRYSEETTMIGLFPLQQILAAGYGRSDLYMKCPGTHLRLERGETRINLFDVIKMTYGPRAATLLQRSCQEQGFRTEPADGRPENGWPLLTQDTFKFFGTCAAIGAAIWFKGRLWS